MRKPISKRDRYEVLRRDNHACRYCGAKAPFVALEIDHVIPVHHGGTNDRWNLTAACQDCNSGKSDGVPNEDVIREVRMDESTYQMSKGHPINPCMHCAKPVLAYPDDDPTDVHQCQTCNEMVCSAYETGRRHGAN